MILRITQDYASLSKQLKKIALYVEQHRDQLGFEGVREFARDCNVHPSAVVRFAQHFGLEGYRDLQTIFRGNLSRQLTPCGQSRDPMRDGDAPRSHTRSHVEMAQEFLAVSVAGMQALEQRLEEAAFGSAVELLLHSDCIVLAASRRSFPVAAYLDYALQHTDKRVITLQTMAHAHLGQAHSARAGDVMVAISFFPYAEETLAVARNALEHGAQLIAITDSGMSPLAQLAQATLVVQENTRDGFRSLSSSMGLAQSLFIAMSHEHELLAQAQQQTTRFVSNEAYAPIPGLAQR